MPAGRFTQISAGWYHTCAVREEGGAVCWGGNDNGQAVAPTALANAAPAPPSTDDRPLVQITKEVRSFGVGARHTCASSTEDEVWCWGSNDAGQIAPPERPLRWLDIGADYSCALTPDGEPVCWGSRWTQANWQENGGTVVYWAYRVGVDHRCRRHSEDGGQDEHRVVCFGDNTYFQAENPAGLYDRVNVGGYHNCVRTLDGQVSCWGRNDRGQSDVPAGRYLDVAAGLAHTCAITSGNALTCWGDNSLGQLDAPSGNDYVELISQSWASHTCAVTSGRELVCWGRNDFGQLDVPEVFRRR